MIQYPGSSYPTKATRVSIKASQIYLIKSRNETVSKSSVLFAPSGRADIPKTPLKFPLDWDTDPYQDRNWCAQLHMWRMMDDYLLRFDRSRNIAWMKMPLAIIEDYFRYHIKERKRSRFAWKDMMVGLRAMKLAYVFSAHLAGHLELSAKQLRACQRLIQRHVRFLTDERHIQYSNHTFIDIHGAMALAQVVSDDDQEIILRLVDRVLPTLLTTQFSRAGLHLENSPGYQRFAIGCLKRLQRATWFRAYDVDALLERAEDAERWLMMPDGRTPAIGDTDGKAPNIGDKLPVDLSPQGEIRHESGYVIVKRRGTSGASRDASYLFLMGAYNSPVHKQSDDLSFVWFEGVDIICDAGKYAYNSDEFAAYARSTRAHNTIEIDATDYYEASGRDQAETYGSAVTEASQREWGYLIAAEVEHRRFSAIHSRVLLYGPGSWLLVIDRLHSDRPHSYTQWFHFSPSSEARIEGDRPLVVLPDTRSLSVIIAASAPVDLEKLHGVREPRTQGWISQGYGQMTPNDTLGAHLQSNNAVIATLLCIGDRGSTLHLDDVSRPHLSLRTQLETQNLLVTLGNDGIEVERQ